jgi:flagellar biosynthesis GTPase FlhF
MELKRILAKDLRRATEKAVKLYGEDVLVISNAKVNGQHEVIVAVDLGAEPAHDDSPWLKANRRADDEDGALFQTALRESVREQKELSGDIEDDVTYDTVVRVNPIAALLTTETIFAAVKSLTWCAMSWPRFEKNSNWRSAWWHGRQRHHRMARSSHW